MISKRYSALIKLLQDDSEFVSESAFEQILLHPLEAWSELSQLQSELFEGEFHLGLKQFIEGMGLRALQADLEEFLLLENQEAMLHALELVDRFPYAQNQRNFRSEIQDLAGQFIQTGRLISPLELVDFLVGDGLYKSVKASEAYNIPVQKQFASLLSTHEGTDFSLSCLCILVGHQLGLEFSLCAFPQRFLVQVNNSGANYFVDLARHGELLGADKLRFHAHRMDTPELALRSVDEMMSPLMMMDMILKRWNTEAYELGRERLGEVLYQLIDACKLYQLSGQLSSKVPRIFHAGELVRHTQYAYRAVVVDWDVECQVSTDWQNDHPKQSVPQEPWYKLLVDDGQRITYVPQSHLIPEQNSVHVRHPLLGYFFEVCPERGYIRNGRLWPTF